MYHYYEKGLAKNLPFKMFLFPIPVIVSIGIWLFLFVSTGWFALWGTLIAMAGIIVYYLVHRNTERTSHDDKNRV